MGRRATATALLVILGALVSYPSGVLPIFRDSLQSHFRIDISRLGLLLSAGMIPGSLAALAAGVLVDRRGPGPVLRVCLAGVGAGMLLAGTASGWGLMALASVVMALFSSPLRVALQTYLVGLFPDNRRRALSIDMAVCGSFGILTPLWAEGLLRLTKASSGVTFAQVLHLPFLGLGLLLLAGAVVCRAKPPEAAELHTAPERGGLASLAPGSALLLLMAVLHATADNASCLWLPRILDSASYPVRPLAPGVVMAVFCLGYAVSRAGLAVLPEEAGRRWMLVAPGLLGGSAFLAGLLSRSQVGVSAGYIAGGFLWSLEYPAILAALAARQPRGFGTALALALLGSGVGAFVLSNAMGYLGAHLGEARLWMILLPPACGFLLVGVAGAFWVARYGQRQ